MRRRLKEAVRLSAGFAMKPGLDYVIVARRDLLKAPFERIGKSSASGSKASKNIHGHRPAPGKNDGKKPQLLRGDRAVSAHPDCLAISLCESEDRERTDCGGSPSEDHPAEPAGRNACRADPGQAQPAQGAVPGAVETRDQAIAKSARVSIDTAAVSGSINLTGARLDDLKLKGYHETVDDKSPIITLFSPSDTQGRLLYRTRLYRQRGIRHRSRPDDGLDGQERRQADDDDACDADLHQRQGRGTFHPHDLVDEHFMFTGRGQDHQRQRRAGIALHLWPRHPLQQADDARASTFCMKASSASSASTA
jgi:hypothetical protein